MDNVLALSQTYLNSFTFSIINSLCIISGKAAKEEKPSSKKKHRKVSVVIDSTTPPFPSLGFIPICKNTRHELWPWGCYNLTSSIMNNDVGKQERYSGRVYLSTVHAQTSHALIHITHTYITLHYITYIREREGAMYLYTLNKQPSDDRITTVCERYATTIRQV